MPIPPLLYGIGDSQPPNFLTLIVWEKILGVPAPITMHFPIMPESYMVLKKYLTTVTPTRGGGWVDDFGTAPSPITISGTFGYRTKGFYKGGVYNGFGWVKYLEWMVDISHVPGLDGELPSVWLMSHASQNFFEVELMDFNISQRVSRNMLWTYELKMTTLNDLSGISIVDTVLFDLVFHVENSGASVLKALGNLQL